MNADKAQFWEWQTSFSLVMFTWWCQVNDLIPLKFFPVLSRESVCFEFLYSSLSCYNEFSGLGASDKSHSTSSLFTEKFESKYLLFESVILLFLTVCTSEHISEECLIYLLMLLTVYCFWLGRMKMKMLRGVFHVLSSCYAISRTLVMIRSLLRCLENFVILSACETHTSSDLVSFP